MFEQLSHAKFEDICWYNEHSRGGSNKKRNDGGASGWRWCITSLPFGVFPVRFTWIRDPTYRPVCLPALKCHGGLEHLVLACIALHLYRQLSLEDSTIDLAMSDLAIPAAVTKEALRLALTFAPGQYK